MPPLKDSAGNGRTKGRAGASTPTSAAPPRGRPAPPGARAAGEPASPPPPLVPLRNPGLPRESLLEMHRLLRLNRLVEEKLSVLYRQGKILGGLYGSLGQEAISV